MPCQSAGIWDNSWNTCFAVSQATSVHSSVLPPPSYVLLPAAMHFNGVRSSCVLCALCLILGKCQRACKCAFEANASPAKLTNLSYAVCQARHWKSKNTSLEFLCSLCLKLMTMLYECRCLACSLFPLQLLNDVSLLRFKSDRWNNTACPKSLLMTILCLRSRRVGNVRNIELCYVICLPLSVRGWAVAPAKILI